MRPETEVLVVGGGAVGICSAYYLREQGLKVTLVDRGEVCSGSSHGNAGLIVPSHSVPLATPGAVSRGLKWMFDPEAPFCIRPRFDLELFSWLWKFRGACNERQQRTAMPFIRDLSFASLQLFEELASLENLSFGYEKKGYLRAYKTNQGLQEGAKEARLVQAIGVKAEILDAAQIQKLEPTLQINLLGGIFYPQDAHLVPGLFVRGLARYLVQRGMDIYPFTEVLGLETSGRRVTTVKTTRGDFAADEVVLACGSWLPEITQDLHLKLPIQAAKGWEGRRCVR